MEPYIIYIRTGDAVEESPKRLRKNYLEQYALWDIIIFNL